MADLRNSELDGQQGEDLLAQCGITVNRNTVPFDPRPASVASGLRIGTSALATRGFGEEQYREVADIIGTALAQGTSADTEALHARVIKLTEDFPLYPGLDQID
jgi:glycine hydroxymethyltransferase